MTRRVLIALAFTLVASPAFAGTSSGYSTTLPDMLFAATPAGGVETQIGDWNTTGLNVTGGFTATGSAVITGSMTALYYDHTSDVRLKTDIHKVDNALDKLLLIHGVEFKWKKDGRRDMGVVAQDVAKVFPNVVHTNSAGMKSVEYDSLIAPMIEAIRELKTENDSLRAEMRAMKAKLDAVRENFQ